MVELEARKGAWLCVTALPDDSMACIFSQLPAHSLRACAATNRAWKQALLRAPDDVRRRLRWRHQWTEVGAGASIPRGDPTVCIGAGTWHPGGVAVAATLQMSKAEDSGFRLILEDASPGDLLAGITLHKLLSSGGTDSPGRRAAASSVGRLLDMGYDFIMGRTGTEGGTAPKSIFYGGRSLRCCFSEPSNCDGPQIDHGPDLRSPGRLAKLRHAGDWVEFSLRGGELRAVDHRRQTFVWHARVSEGEIWVPTLAWTGKGAIL